MRQATLPLVDAGQIGHDDGAEDSHQSDKRQEYERERVERRVPKDLGFGRQFDGFVCHRLLVFLNDCTNLAANEVGRTIRDGRRWWSVASLSDRERPTIHPIGLSPSRFQHKNNTAAALWQILGKIFNDNFLSGQDPVALEDRFHHGSIFSQGDVDNQRRSQDLGP